MLLAPFYSPIELKCPLTCGVGRFDPHLHGSGALPLESRPPPPLPLAVGLRVLRLTSERQLAECLHPAVVCLCLDPSNNKRLKPRKPANTENIQSAFPQRYNPSRGPVREVRCAGGVVPPHRRHRV